jgi:hypothetical protein
MWRDRDARMLVIGLAILMLALWVVPQKLGGGSVSGLATHAQGNHSKTSCVNASFPFSCELDNTLWPLVLERLEIASLIMIGITSFLVIRSRRQLENWSAALRRYPAALAASIAGAFGFIWWLGISAETQEGFAGNPRYAVIGVMLVCISGAAAYGWACTGLARLAGTGLRRLSQRRPDTRVLTASWKARATATTALMVLIFLFVPNWFAHRMPSIASIRDEARYEAQLREGMSYLIDDYGGSQNVVHCGSMMANNLQVTMLAWYIDEPIYYVKALPVYKLGQLSTKVKPGPNIVFQDGTSSSSPTSQKPTPLQMQVWSQGWKQKNGSSYKIIFKKPVTLYANCSAYIRNP